MINVIGKRFLVWGMIIMLLFSVVPPVLAENGSTGLPEEIGMDALNAVPNDTGPKLALVENGESRSTIILSQSATEQEQKAAQELKDYIKQISEVELPVVSNSIGVDGIKIYIGSAAPDLDTAKAAIRAEGDEPDSFRLHVEEGAINLVGLDDRDKGSLYAVYELLEQIGVRWFMPGDIGTVVPELETIEVNYQDTIQHAGLSFRFFQATTPYLWAAGMPMGSNLEEAAPWVEHMRLNQKTVGAHELLSAPPSRSTRADLYLPNADGTPSLHLDVTKPEVLDMVVAESLAKMQKNPNLEYLSIGPSDGHVVVLKPDPEWDGDDRDVLTGALSTTDRYIKFFNLVLEELEKEGYQDVKIVFYAYNTYYNPPVRWTPNQRIVPMIASLTLDRIHSIGNPLAWERNYLKEVIDGWNEVSPTVMIYDYLYNPADPGLPVSLAERVGTEYKYFKEHGVIGIRAETTPEWGYGGLGLYLAAKMMWNPDLDVEALREDYFTTFYGPAASPMKEHFEILENAFARADYSAGNIYDFQHILTDEVMQELARTLGEAKAKVASDSVYAKRIDMISIANGFSENFLEMLEQFNLFHFDAAKEKLNNVYDFREQAVLHSPAILSSYKAYTYVEWFFDRMVNGGKQRVSNGNQIVAELPDEWNVKLFPNASGVDLGLWKPGLGTESWGKLKTYSKTWSAQGLRYYKGHAWYRTTIDIAEEYDTGKPIRLWFSSIDETARVWINGEELTLVQKGTGLTKPWEFDATPAVKFGEPNVIVVDVRNEDIDELGTGGIMGPAMLWQVNTELDYLPPADVKNLKAVHIPGTTTVKVTWDIPADNTGVTGYQLEMLNRESVGGVLGSVITTTNEYIDTGMEPGMERRYRVKAIDTGGNKSVNYSAYARVTMNPPSTVTGLKVKQTSANQVYISWDPSTVYEDFEIAGYSLEVLNQNPPGGVLETIKSTTNAYILSGLQPGMTRRFRVKAIDTAGNMSADYSAVVQITMAENVAPAGPPTTPTGLKSEPLANGAMKISWDPATSDVGIAKYMLEVWDVDGGAGQLMTVEATTNEFIFTDYFKMGIVRKIRVLAVDHAGGQSAVSAFMTLKVPPTKPTLTVEQISDTEVKISWTASESVYGMREYVLELLNPVPPGGVNKELMRALETEFIHTGLEADGKTLRYRVRAIDQYSTAFPNVSSSDIVEITMQPQ
jgi:hypothetical protein